MAGNVLSKLTLALIADSSSYSSGLQKAQKLTADSAKTMGTSLSGFRKTAESEMGATVKSMELINKQQKLVRDNLEKTATSAKSELARVNAAVKLSQMEQEKWARAWQKNTLDVEKTTTSSVGKLGQALGGLKAPLAAAAAGLAAMAGAQSIKGTLELTSQFNVLNQRIKSATKETGDFNSVSEKLYAMSRRNGAALADTVSVFQGLARSAKEVGKSNSEMLQLTDTIQKLGVIGGSSAAAMSAGLLQFSQSMASGVVRAEEWNSVVENMPEVAHRIAVGMGLTDGEIRKVMLSGKLLSKDVVESLLKQSGQIEKEFVKMPKSMAQAYESLATSTGLALAQLDKIFGATKLAVSGIEAMSKALDNLRIAAKTPFDAGNGTKTDIGHVWKAAQNQGFGLKKLGDDFNGVADLVGGFNLMDPKKALTWQQIADRHRQREAARRAQVASDLALPEEEKAQPSVKYPKLNSGSGVDEKAIKKHAKDIQRADDLLATMRAQNAELEAKLRKDDEAVTKEKALLKLSKDRTLTDKERNKYAEEINKLAARHAELVKQESIQKEQEKLKEILASHKEKIELLKAELSGETENNSILTAQKEIRNAVKVGMKETAKAQQEIRDAAKEEAVLRDAVKLKGIEDSLKSQLASTMAKNDNAAELIPILEAEKKIREAITAGMDQNVAQQERIKELARQLSDEILQKQYEAESKKISEIGKGLDDENEKLKLKLAGQENLAKYLDSERDVRNEIAEATAKTAEHIKAIQDSSLSDSDKKDRIQKVQQHAAKLQDEAAQKIAGIRQAATENTKLTQALTDQEKILENIKDSTGSYKQKLAELDAQYAKGNITQKQWSKTAEELWKAQSKTTHSLGDGIKQLGQGMMTAIANGTKLTDVFKNMGKQLLALAAQKLLLEPLANSLDNISQKLFGTGKYTSKPVMPGTPGYGQIASNQPMLGNALGGPVGGGVLSTAGSGALNLLKSLLNSSNNTGSTTSQPISSTDAGYLLSGYGGYNMKGYASGGYYGSDQPFIAGERGPELIVPGSSGRVFDNQQTMSMFGAYGSMAGFSAGSGGRYGGALSEISGYQKQLLSGYDTGGRQLGYWDRQELNAKIQDKYKYSMNWNTGDEMMLAQVSDDLARAQARAYLANPTKYNGNINDNEYQRMSLRATYGTGAVDAVTAGGRASWGAGDQMKEQLLAAQDQGVAIPQQLLDKASFDAANWKQAQETFNPTGPMDPYNWIGRGSYHSMGVGAGEGNTNNGAVYGGDFWDPKTGANGQERMDALGGKEFMWEKYHGGKGAGYENVTDMWARSHSAEYQAGRNFIGKDGKGDKGRTGGYINEYQPKDSWVDADGNRLRISKTGWIDGLDGHYTKGGSRYYGDDQLEYLNPELEAKMKRQRREAYDMTHPPITQDIPPIPRSGYQDMIDSGTYVPKTNGDMMDGLDNLRNRSSRYDAEFKDILNAKNDAKAARDELKRMLADAKLDAKNTKKYGPDWRALSGDFSRDQSRQWGINSGRGVGGDGWGELQPEGGLDYKNGVDLRDKAAKDDEAFMEEFRKTGKLTRIESHLNDIMWGGAVGSGKLTTSHGGSFGDVFDQQTSVRAKNPYYNFADGFDSGYFGARTGADIGATSPSSGWQIRSVRQGVRAIKGYAQGGMLSGGEMALVGERGPELIVPKAAARVIPNDKLGTAGGGGGVNIQLINNTGVQMAKPQMIQHPDGSIGLLLQSAAANASRNGVIAQGTRQAGRSVNR